MNIQGVTPSITAAVSSPQSMATTKAASSSSSSSSSGSSDLQTTFLNLLITELQNQDPTSPVDPTAMVGQMVSLNQLDQLITQLKAKTPRNLLRAAYYDGKNAVRDLGISMPPQMRRVAVVLGWSAKAVDILNRRCNLDGFVIPGGSADDLGLADVWTDNFLDTEAPQAGVSSLIHSTSFLITTQGDQEAGEPAVLVTAKDALSGTGIWNRRRRRLDSFLSIIDTDDDANPTEMVMYLDGLNVSMTRTSENRWIVERRRHAFGVPVEPLVYQPRLARPFGSSRISRAVMSLHDSAIRTVIRSEVTGLRGSSMPRPPASPAMLANLVWMFMPPGTPKFPVSR